MSYCPNETTDLFVAHISQCHTAHGSVFGNHGIKCKIFIWLAVRNRCWTADMLAKKGLPHPSHCVFCGKERKDIQHILTTCVLALDFLFKIQSQFGFEARSPKQREDTGTTEPADSGAYLRG
jgi:hypothetical protein